MDNLSNIDIINNIDEFRNLIKQQKDYSYQVQEELFKKNELLEKKDKELKLKNEETEILIKKVQKYKYICKNKIFQENLSKVPSVNRKIIHYNKKLKIKKIEIETLNFKLVDKIKEIDNLKIKLDFINLELENKKKEIKEIKENNKLEESNKLEENNKLEKKLLKKKIYKKEILYLKNENDTIKSNLDMLKNILIFNNKITNITNNSEKNLEIQLNPQLNPQLIYSNVDITQNNNLVINSFSQKKELNIESSSKKTPIKKIDNIIINHQMKMGNVLNELKNKICSKYIE